jgi:hypothetical protein
VLRTPSRPPAFPGSAPQASQAPTGHGAAGGWAGDYGAGTSSDDRLRSRGRYLALLSTCASVHNSRHVARSTGDGPGPVRATPKAALQQCRDPTAVCVCSESPSDSALRGRQRGLLKARRGIELSLLSSALFGVGIDPGRTLFIAAYSWDLRAAAGHRFRTVHLPRPHSDAPDPGDHVDAEFSSLDEVVTGLARERARA